MAAAAAIKMKVAFCVWTVLALLSTKTVSAKEETVYFKVGGEIRLKPPVTAPLTVITWKLGGDLVAEWTSGSAVIYYRSFKGRTSLDVTTGELQIRNAVGDFAGSYKVEINDVDVTTISWRAVLLKGLDLAPQMDLKPLTCSVDSKTCSLVCMGNTSQAGPVTYLWQRDSGGWTDGTDTLEIANDDETKKVQEFSCRMKNLVSDSPTASIANPFYTSISPAAVAVPIVIVVLVLALTGLAGWCYKSGKYRDYFTTSTSDQPETGK